MAKTSSDYTKVTRKKLWLWRIIDAVVLFLPVLIYVFIALGDGNLVTTTTAQKVSVSLCVIIALVLSIFNTIAQKRLRCPIWIILIGLYVAIKELLLPLIIMLAIASILDDFFFTTIIEYYRSKLIASKVIDERDNE